MRCRRGYTLLEMSITLAVLAIASALVVPALVNFGETPARRTAGELLGVLAASRKLAIDSNVAVVLVLDPSTGRYRADSTGPFGSGPVTEGSFATDAMELFVTDQARLVWRFRSTGAASGDTVLVRGTNESLLVVVDPWNGVAWTDAR
jgi:prepilin-type N-terminal cleavage/methylation domain-containing protein